MPAWGDGMDAHIVPDPTVRLIRVLAGGAKRIVFVSGNFNIVHPGHLRLLKFAAEAGDFLVVGVSDDLRPALPYPPTCASKAYARYRLSTTHSFWRIPPVPSSPSCSPTWLSKARSTRQPTIPNVRSLKATAEELLFGSGEVRFSSLNLLQREYFELNLSTISVPKDYPTRHGFSMSDLKHALQKVQGLRVLVIGDLIIDEYINCDPIGMSQEDPTIVLIPIESKTFVGGAGIVAAHARGLGAEVEFLTFAGADEPASYAEESLSSIMSTRHCSLTTPVRQHESNDFARTTRRCFGSITFANTQSRRI